MFAYYTDFRLRLAERLKLDDRIEKLAKKEAFITLKDHKPNFQDHPTCRLINPSKSEIGVISKHILDEINTSIINGTKINQWKNTSSVLKWFNSLENKSSLSFICFDVCEFYPSITEKLLSNVLDFATKYCRITSHERENYSASKTISAIQRKFPMGEEICKQPFRCHHGVLRRGRNMWIGWLLPFVPPYKEVWPKHRLIPRRWIGSPQGESTGSGED